MGAVNKIKHIYYNSEITKKENKNKQTNKSMKLKTKLKIAL